MGQDSPATGRHRLPNPLAPGGGPESRTRPPQAATGCHWLPQGAKPAGTPLGPPESPKEPRGAPGRAGKLQGAQGSELFGCNLTLQAAVQASTLQSSRPACNLNLQAVIKAFRLQSEPPGFHLSAQAAN